MPVKLSELYIDNTNYDSFINNYERNVGDSLSIRGKIQTLNNTYIDGGKVEIITFVSQSDDGNYYNIGDNNSIQLSNGIIDTMNKKTITPKIAIDLKSEREYYKLNKKFKPLSNILEFD